MTTPPTDAIRKVFYAWKSDNDDLLNIHSINKAETELEALLDALKEAQDKVTVANDQQMFLAEALVKKDARIAQLETSRDKWKGWCKRFMAISERVQHENGFWAQLAAVSATVEEANDYD